MPRSLSSRIILSGATAAVFSLSAGSHASTLEAGVLTIGSDLTYPPYNYLENKKAAGFDAEFMEKIAAGAKLNAKVVDTRFANLILGVNLGKIDVVASTLYVTPERAKQVDYIPYMKTGGSLVSLKTSAFQPTAPEDLCGKRVSSIKGAAWIAKFNKLSETTCKEKGLDPIVVREFPSSPEATQALLAKAVDAQFEDAAVSKAAVEKSGGRLVISSQRVIYPVVVGLALDKKNTELTTALTQSFDAYKKSGEYDKLLKKYNVELPTAAEVQAALEGKL